MPEQRPQDQQEREISSDGYLRSAVGFEELARAHDHLAGMWESSGNRQLAAIARQRARQAEELARRDRRLAEGAASVDGA